MSDQLVQVREHPEPRLRTKQPPKQITHSAGAATLPLSLDPAAMARICIELLTRATLYAGAIGLIVGLAAALLFRE